MDNASPTILEVPFSNDRRQKTRKRGNQMAFPLPASLALVKKIKSTLDSMITNIMSKKDHDFNNAPANAIQARLNGLVTTLSAAKINYDDLDNHLRYIDYLVAMIATSPQASTNAEAFGDIMQEPDHTANSAELRCTSWVEHTNHLVAQLGNRLVGASATSLDPDPVLSSLGGISATLKLIAADLPTHYMSAMRRRKVRGKMTIFGAASKS